MKLKSERTQDETFITTPWPSIDTYLFCKFEVRKNFGLSQSDKDYIKNVLWLLPLCSQWCWLQLVSRESIIFMEYGLMLYSKKCTNFKKSRINGWNNSRIMTNKHKLIYILSTWSNCHLSISPSIDNLEYPAIISVSYRGR